MLNNLIDINNLQISFQTSDGLLTAVDGVSFYVRHGETLGIVGESGCGKSITALSIMGLIPNPPGIVKADRILFNGESLLGRTKNEMRQLRGSKISMIFQEPMTSLNPVLTIGFQLTEVFKTHNNMSKDEAAKKALNMMEKVGISMPERCFKAYPHELSGGMRQRIMIAMALLCDPALLIADEPTTALDVTIQAQILDLMIKLKNELGMAIMLITHDLGVVAEVCERTIVMYAGKIVEQAETIDLFKNPQHPYTKGLLNSIPRLERANKRLSVIKGVVPNLMEMPKGCKFNPRCMHAMPICLEQEAPLIVISSNHEVACWMYSGSMGKVGMSNA